MRAENPPQKPGRPRIAWLEMTYHERFCRALKDPRWKARSSRRHSFANQYASFGAEALGINDRAKDYSAENVEHFKRLAKKSILEQLGRHLMFMTNVVGCDPDEAIADTRDMAEELLKEDNLDVESVIAFFRWLREPIENETEDLARDETVQTNV